MYQRQLDPKQEEKKSLYQRRVSSRPAADLEVIPQAGRAPSGQLLLALQERYGNRHVQRMVDAARFNRSLEATSVDGTALSIVQRQELAEEEEGKIQAKVDRLRVGAEGGPVSPDVESAIQRARGGGQWLSAGFSSQYGERLGYDFNHVRVHTDSEADALNQQLNARAFTTGGDIFFRWGEYNPGSGSGGELLAHELTHVVQQSSGRVSGGGTGMTVRAAGDVFEQEADRIADPVLHAVQTNGDRKETEYPATVDPIRSIKPTRLRLGDRIVQRTVEAVPVGPILGEAEDPFSHKKIAGYGNFSSSVNWIPTGDHKTGWVVQKVFDPVGDDYFEAWQFINGRFQPPAGVKGKFNVHDTFERWQSLNNRVEFTLDSEVWFTKQKPTNMIPGKVLAAGGLDSTSSQDPGFAGDEERMENADRIVVVTKSDRDNYTVWDNKHNETKKFP